MNNLPSEVISKIKQFVFIDLMCRRCGEKHAMDKRSGRFACGDKYQYFSYRKNMWFPSGDCINMSRLDGSEIGTWYCEMSDGEIYSVRKRFNPVELDIIFTLKE